jgi:hypothetical protein
VSDWHVLGLDGDPTPGDPDRTTTLAGRLLNQAELAERNRQRLAQVASGGGDLRMEGDYAPKFREILAELPGELAKLSKAYQGSGQALRTFASDLRAEKGRAGTALRHGTDASARYEGALREIRSLLPGGRELEVSPLGVEAAFAELRAFSASSDFAVLNGLRNAEAFGLARLGPQELAINIADSYPHLRGITDGELMDAVTRFLRS